MQPNLLRNLCFLPTKNKKYRTFYRTHFLLISITCLSRYISLSFYRPALIGYMENFLENCPPSKIIRNHDKCTKSTFLRTCVTYFKLDLFWRLLFSGLCCEPQPPPPHTHTPIIAHINTEKPCFSSAHEAVGPANDVRCWVSTSVEAQFDLSDLLVNSSEHWMELNTNYVTGFTLQTLSLSWHHNEESLIKTHSGHFTFVDSLAHSFNNKYFNNSFQYLKEIKI